MLLKMGFRPFFFLAGLHAALMLTLWVLALSGHLLLPSELGAVGWHAHEMLYGFVGAAVAGFLLTAVPKWTGTEPLAGEALMLLVAFWLAGRTVAWVSGGAILQGTQVLFWLGLLVAIGVPIVRTRNARNYKVLALVAALGVSNVAQLGAYSLKAQATTLWLITALMALIGGRILPMFTTNGLSAQRGEKLPPIPPARWEKAPMACLVAAALADLASPWPALNATFCVLAALGIWANGVRFRGLQTGRVPLLWSLHAGYAFIGLSLALRGLYALHRVPYSAALHALTAGAMGSMIIAMMTRVSRGHTGRALLAGPVEVTMYALVIAGGLLRVVSAFWPQSPLVWVAGTLFLLGYALFVVAYARILAGPPPAGPLAGASRG